LRCGYGGFHLCAVDGCFSSNMLQCAVLVF
jgi:hypothetical protein